MSFFNMVFVEVEVRRADGRGKRSWPRPIWESPLIGGQTFDHLPISRERERDEFFCRGCLTAAGHMHCPLGEEQVIK